jgi:photosystem II stability/assembly factor-like uncharacterized protein
MKLFRPILYILIFCASIVNGFAQWEKVDGTPLFYENSYWLEIFILPSNSNYIWICGFEGRIARSVDQGKTWIYSTIDGAGHMESIFFVDAKVGYAVSAADEMNFASRIYKSVDGGASWREVTPPNMRDRVWGIYFLDANIGEAAGGECFNQIFYRTTDGGRNWKKIEYTSLSGKLSDLTLNPDGTGFAAASGTIWATTDAGLTWKEKYRTGNQDWHEDFSHFDDCFVVPYDIGCSGEGQDIGGVRVSVDNGRTWKDKTFPRSMYGCYAAKKDNIWVCGKGRSVYHSTDAGNNWTLETCGIPANTDLDDIYFINDTLGWVVGQGIYKYKKYIPTAPKISSVKTEYCEGETATISADKDYPYFYSWSNGMKTKSIKVKKSGTYYLTTNTVECDSGVSNKIEIKFYPKPLINFDGPKNITLCGAETVKIKYTGAEDNFRWSDGDNNREKVFDKQGIYYISAENAAGCKAVDSVVVNVIDKPTGEILEPTLTSICDGATINLEATGNFKNIRWMTKGSNQPIAEGTRKLAVSKSGEYYAIISNGADCADTLKAIALTVSSAANALRLASNKQVPIMIDSAYYLENSCAKIQIENVSNTPISLNTTRLAINRSFSIPPAELNKTLTPKSISDINICYSPGAIGIERDTLIIDDFCTPLKIPVYGYGTSRIININTDCGTGVGMRSIKIDKNNSIFVSAPYPNPSVGKISIPYSIQSQSANANKEYSLNIKVYNAYGNEALVKNASVIGNLASGKFEIDLSEFESGIYFLTISNDYERIGMPISIVK